MSEQTADATRAESEAAAWFAELGRTPIATHTLRDFQAWRQSAAANAAAYDAIEARWQAMPLLANDPDIEAVIADTLRRRPPRPAPRARPGGAILLGAGLLAGCAVAGWLMLVAFPTYSTHVGEQRLVVLRDGSRVRLNTDSKLKVRFGLQDRRVILARGEAFFEAAHDPAKPFVVEADGARVRAIGTKFNVRRTGGGVQVTLVEGRVQVGRAATPNEATLLPNQQLTVTPARVTMPSPVDGLQAASWTTGRLVFRGVPLSSAIQEINRYTGRKIVLEAPADLAGQPVSGSFDPGDPKAFVQAATTLFDLKADWSDDDQVRLISRPSAGG
jgi:transmembrane sensor